MRTSFLNSWKGKKLPAWVWGLLALGGLLLSMALSPGETPVYAGNGSPDRVTTASGITPPADIGFSALDVLLKLGVVIGLIYVSLYLLRHWQGQLAGRATRQMRVVESLSLAPRQTLHLVRVGSQTLLIGATDQTLTSLGVVTLPPEPEPEPEKPAPAFSTFLAHTLPLAFSPAKVSHDLES
ncbi:MAG: flagellar biosynthetic protein FliO [Anaerolineales bacterium]|nr:flagellar biosynthetic protein FliO [Anaerolineales bacterium]